MKSLIKLTISGWIETSDLRAAIYQTGVSDPELREIKRQMITVLEEAEKELLREYLKTANGVYAAKE